VLKDATILLPPLLLFNDGIVKVWNYQSVLIMILSSLILVLVLVLRSFSLTLLKVQYMNHRSQYVTIQTCGNHSQSTV